MAENVYDENGFYDIEKILDRFRVNGAEFITRTMDDRINAARIVFENGYQIIIEPHEWSLKRKEEPKFIFMIYPDSVYDNSDFLLCVKNNMCSKDVNFMLEDGIKKTITELKVLPNINKEA